MRGNRQEEENEKYGCCLLSDIFNNVLPAHVMHRKGFIDLLPTGLLCSLTHSLNNSANRNRKETCYSPSVEDAIVQLYSSAATSTVWLPQQSTELQFKWTNRADASHANLWQGLPIISPIIFFNRHHSNAIDHRIKITTSHTTRHDRQTSRLHSNLSRPFLTTEIISISIFY